MPSFDDYRRASGDRFNSASGPMTVQPVTGRPAPSNVMDGRFFGDETWSMLSAAMPMEANNAETAAKVAAVFFCVSIIAEAVGSLSLEFKDDNGPRNDFPLANVLAYEPNHLQTGAEFWAAMAFAGVLRGEAFAEPVAGFDGLEVWALNPLRTVASWGERSMHVDYASEQGPRRLLPQQLFWFTGIADGGLRPLVPWRQAKGAIDFQLALEVGARSFFRNDRRPSGIVTTDQKLTDASADRIAEGVRQWKRGGTPVFEQGLTYEAVGSSNTDAQLVELIRQRTLEMGRYWRIPRSMIGDEGGNAGNNEQDTRSFVNWALRPLTRRIEQAITVRMLPPDLRAQGVRARFNLDSMLRGDAATQWRNAVLARTASIMSVDEIRTGWFGLSALGEDWASDPRAALNSNRAADTTTGGETAPQDKVQ
ncbi:phage portal protein [Sphingomonas sp. KR1UV-12]|uniref:Phage portal protein n=1 Tax=Sphingomonas aurea TaxID=3063994 RepID=A0ABT9EHC8_9SPHN|nr:phage portal protein [Sphingomonas sp. KR1UV-12]MDP1026385.1 phage portal protein [Sphingomonas sp. KR1UV-12]